VERLTAEVTGRVQGVGFRYFVQGEAARHGVQGYVRNLPEGRQVEVVAEGDRAHLEQLLTTLKQGPPGAHVENVRISWSPGTGQFSGFSIRH
jgi:acylphosphatase